jgi:hypothetical protein
MVSVQNESKYRGILRDRIYAFELYRGQACAPSQAYEQPIDARMRRARMPFTSHGHKLPAIQRLAQRLQLHHPLHSEA